MPARLEQASLLALGFDLPLWALLFVLAISPGICEELLFRGALLTAQRRDLSAAKVVLWQALLFGAAHASIYRFAPTAAVGALLACVALRARSVLPGMLLHAAYNGLLVAATLGGIAWAASPWLALLGLPGAALLLFTGPPGSGARRAP